MRYLFITLTFWTALFFLQGTALSQTSPQANRQDSEQNRQQLSLDRIKAKILVYTQAKNEQNKAAIDKSIAAEVDGIDGKDFYLDDAILNELRKLGAGPQTIQALERLKRRRANITGERAISTDKIILLVANFYSDDNQDYAITNLILDRLSDYTKDYPDVEVKPLKETINAQQGRKEAIAKGKEHNANIVIWGWLSKIDQDVIINAHFESVKSPSGVAAPYGPEMTESLVAGLSELKTFTIQINLSRGVTALTLFATGLARFDANDFKAAISRFSEALNQEAVSDTVRSNILLARGVSYLADQGFNSKNAFNDFKEAVRANSKNSFPYQYLALILLAEGKPDDAIAECKLLLESDADTEAQSLAYFILGLTFDLKGDFDQGNYFFDKLIQVSGSDSSSGLFALRGMAYLFKKDVKSALENYDVALRLTDDPRKKGFIKGMKGQVYFLQGDCGRATKELEEAIQLDQYDSCVYDYMGQSYSCIKDYKRAIENYTSAIKLSKTCVDCYYHRGEAYYAGREWDKAVSDFSQYLSLSEFASLLPVHAYALMLRGEAYYQLENNDKALEDYNHAIAALNQSILLSAEERNLNLVRSLYNRANVFSATKQWDKAISDYGEIIRLTPKDAKAFLYRGNALNRKGLPGEALKDYSQAIILDPKNVRAYLARGKLYAATGEKDNAISDLQKVLQITNESQLRQEAQQQLNLLGVK